MLIGLFHGSVGELVVGDAVSGNVFAGDVLTVLVPDGYDFNMGMLVMMLFAIDRSVIELLQTIRPV